MDAEPATVPMNAAHLESALRILVAHRNSRPACQQTRSLIRKTIELIRRMRQPL